MNNTHTLYHPRKSISFLSSLILFCFISISDAGAQIADTTDIRQPFWSNTFYKVTGGVNMHHSTLDLNYSLGSDVSMAFGKYFGRYSSVRLSGTVESYYVRNRRRAWLGEANVLYGFNIHNLFQAKQPQRIFQFIPYLGVGFDIERSKGRWGTNGNAQFGIEMGLKLTENLYFTLEPVGKYYMHQFEEWGVPSTEYSASLMAGFKYEAHNLNWFSTYNRDRYIMEKSNPFMNFFFLDNTFYRFGAGINMQKSTVSNGYYVGTSFDFSMGKRVAKLHSVMLKFALDKGYNKSQRYNVDIFELSAIYGFDLSSALYGYKFNRIFNISFLTGGGLDFIDVEGYNVLNGNIQAGGDVNVKLNDSFSIFLNPMAKIFLIDNKERLQARRFSVELLTTLGLQYTVHRKGYRNPDGDYIRDTPEEMRALALEDRRIDKRTNSMSDNTFITFLGGTGYRTATKRDYKPGFEVSFEVGKNLNRFNSLAIGFDYENFLCKTTSKYVEVYEIDLIHSLNLTNLNHMKGRFRHFDLKTVGGLGINQNYSQYYSGISAVAMLGIEASFNATPTVSFIIRPTMKGYYGKVTDLTFRNSVGYSGHINAGIRLNMANRIVKANTGHNSETSTDIPMSKYGFNALQYSLQKRYRPMDKTAFARKYHFDNSYIHIGYGMENVAYNAVSYDWLKNVHIGYGKRFSKYNSIIANLSAGAMRNRISNVMASFNELEVLHSFHMTSMLHGYFDGRIFEVSTLEGLGVDVLHDDDEWRFNGNIMLGLDLKLRLSKTLSFFVDPYFKVYTDGINGDLADNWRGYDFGYGFSTGLRINLTSRDDR